MVSAGSDHQSLRLRAPSFGSGGGSGTLRSIIVLISVICTILSATTTEVTIKGFGSLALAILALVLAVRSFKRSHQPDHANIEISSRVTLEPDHSRKSWRLTSLRLTVGSMAGGAVLAITTAVFISTVLGQVLDRLK